MRSKRPSTVDRSVPAAAPPSTPERLLEIAGEVFAERGFRGATIREISRRAGTNVAAVNYHFGDKQRLYFEVLRAGHAACVERHPADGGLPHDAPADERLRAFVRALLARVRGVGRPAWQGRLMAKEFADPTAAIDQLVRDGIAPQFELLQGIVRELLGARATAEEVALATASIVGQCLFWFFAEAVIARLPALRTFRSADALDAIARHVHVFSRAALARPAADRAHPPRHPERHR